MSIVHQKIESAAREWKAKEREKDSTATGLSLGTTPSLLAAALVTAQSNLGKVRKDRTNSFHGYDYASAESMTAACRVALNEAGLALTHRWHAVHEDGQWLLDVGFTLYHQSGESRTETVSWPVIPERGRPLDKAMAAGLTSCMGYYLRGLLLVPRDEKGMDDRDDRSYDPAKQSRQRQQTQENGIRPAAKPPARPAKKASKGRGPAGSETVSAIEVVEGTVRESADGRRYAMLAVLMGGEAFDLFHFDDPDAAVALAGQTIAGEVETRTTRSGSASLVLTSWKAKPRRSESDFEPGPDED